MARISTYVSHARSTEAAFGFYRDVFLTEPRGPIARVKDVPAHPGQPPPAPADEVCISLEPGTRAETDRLFAALAEDGTVEMPLQEMSRGGYVGSLVDRYGIRWMLTCP